MNPWCYMGVEGGVWRFRSRLVFDRIPAALSTGKPAFTAEAAGLAAAARGDRMAWDFQRTMGVTVWEADASGRLWEWRAGRCTRCLTNGGV